MILKMRLPVIWIVLVLALAHRAWGQSTDSKSPPPGVPASSKPELAIIQRDIEYGRAGDRPLKLDLVRPKQPKADRLPVVVMIHGGGWQRGDKSRALNGVAILAARGDYVGVAVGYRLSGEAKWPAQIHDCKAAIRWLRANAGKFGIDPDRIGVWGSSAGGHLVNLLGTTGDVKELEGDCGTPGVSSRVQAVASSCGPTDFLAERRIQGGREPSSVSLLLGGPVDEMKAAARQASPINHVTPDDAPFLLVHGTEDPTVPFQQSELFLEALRKAGVDATLVRVEGGGHGSGGLEARNRVYAFFDRRLHHRDVKLSVAPISSASRPGKPASTER